MAIGLRCNSAAYLLVSTLFIASCAPGFDSSEKFMNIGKIALPADLLISLDQDISRDRLGFFFQKLSENAARSNSELSNIASIRIEPELSRRWMTITFRTRNINGQVSATEWTARGQITSKDALQYDNSIRFIPRWVTNSTDLDGTGIAPNVAEKGWKDLRPQLETLARIAAIEAGLKAYAPPGVPGV